MKELSIEERIDWFEATLKECCSNINTLNTEQFLNVLFEELCIDVVSCFSEYSLGILIDAGLISDTNKDICINIRDLYITYENEFRACTNPEEIKSMKQWKEINDLADNAWADYIKFKSRR